MTLDLTASFANVVQPTPFAIYDADTSFQADANGMIQYVYTKLGGRTLNVELTNKDVYTSFEEAALEYSSTINSYQARSVLADIIGSQTGSLSGHEQQLPRMSLAAANKAAGAYSAEALVGGTRTLYSASISLNIGQQNYDLNALLSASGKIGPTGQIQLEEVFHFSPTAAYRFFDTTSAINYLHNQFSFESFTPETVFYLLPVWEDVLRAQQMEMSHKVRRSNYSYHVTNNVLRIYPVPTLSTNLHFTYYLNGDNPWDANDPALNGVTNLSNVPFGNISYAKVNSIGKQWIRRFALCLSKEVLGQVRSKVAEVPIPNGTLTLNGNELISQAREEQGELRGDLKALLESMTYQALAAQELERSQALQQQLNKVPMLIYVG
jgi:hypothetical protein